MENRSRPFYDSINQPVWKVPGCPRPASLPEPKAGLPRLRKAGAVRLLDELKGRHLCLMGDSVTSQMYNFMQHLSRRHGLVVSVPYKTPVRPSLFDLFADAKKEQREYLKSRGFRLWWGMMTHVTSFRFGRKGGLTSKVSFLKHQKWEPYDIRYFDDFGCDLIVMNMGLHYAAKNLSGTHGVTLEEGAAPHVTGKPRRYIDDVEQLVEWAVNWTSFKPGRLVIYRDTLPQHFAFSDTGIYWMDEYRKGNVKCGPLKGRNKMGTGEYNAVFDEVYSKMEVKGCPGLLRTHDRPSGVEEYWAKYNWTGELQAEAVRRRGHQTRSKVGRVGVLPLWEMFADLPDLHVKQISPPQHDCTHWCYVPGVWDAVLERLALTIEVETQKANNKTQCGDRGVHRAPAGGRR
eukprot:Hpha_TRINITY_DN15655_c3_g1::TRINITY_DN15655_c3_g1_i3::g.102044::m.102044